MLNTLALTEKKNSGRRILLCLLRHKSRTSVWMCTGVCEISLTCVVAQALSLLSPPVEPDAEAHEDDPAGPSDPGDEGRLFHHISDLLCDAVVPVSVYDHVPEFLT